MCIRDSFGTAHSDKDSVERAGCSYVKSTASPGVVALKLTTTGLIVPGVNGGMLTVALVGIPTTVKDCRPVPVFTWSTVTEF